MCGGKRGSEAGRDRLGPGPGGGINRIEHLFSAIDHRPQGLDVAISEATLDHRSEQRRQRPPITGGVQDHDRLGMQAKLFPGRDLDGFIQGAEPARQGDKGIGQFEHALLAAVHAVGDDQFGQIVAPHFAAPQEIRDHARDLATGVQHRVGNHAHQADMPAAINQADVLLGHQTAEGPRGVFISRIAARARAAKDTDG